MISMSEEVIGAMELPLDSDDFLRRNCPHCRREFKWHNGDSGTEMEAAGYHCPYCDGRAEEWWTDPQLRVVEKIMGHYAEEQLHGMFKGLERRSSEFVKIEAGPAPRQPQTTLPEEPDDMRRVEFTCHPGEPVKVLDEWAEPVHCLVCGVVG
jgi:hypothetical protein